MKRILLPAFAFLTITAITNAQDKKILKDKLIDTNNNDDFLSWITTSIDIVDQDKKNVLQIDNEIDRVITSQKDKNIFDIEVPINYKKLLYYPQADIRNLVVLSFNIFENDADGNYSDAINPKFIYRYGNLFIQSTGNSNRDQLNVYAIIRAYLIIKNKYPEIYKVLFERTEETQFGNDVIKNINPTGVTFINSNRNYIFTIHENAVKALAATTTNYGWGGNLNTKLLKKNFLVSDNNNHFIFLNKQTLINGGVTTGGKNIYIDAESSDREIKYLFDGLLQTFVHERMHNYVGNYSGVDSFLSYIRNDNSLLNGGGTYKYMEEPIVTNTTNLLFKKYGGLSNDVMKYYVDLFGSTQLDTLKTLPAFKELIVKLKELNKTNNDNLEKVLLLNIFSFDKPAQRQQQPPQQPLQKRRLGNQTIHRPVQRN